MLIMTGVTSITPTRRIGTRSRVMDGGKAAGPVGIAGGKIYYQGLFQDSK